MVSLDEVGKSRKKSGKNDEAAETTNDRPDLLPTSRFWLEVDGRIKKAWAELATAQQEAKVLKQKFPHLRVAVYDAAERERISVD